MQWWIDLFAKHWMALLTAGIYLAGGWIGAGVVRWVLRRVAARLAGRTKTTLDDRLLEAINRPAGWAIVLVGIYLALDTLGTHVPGLAQLAAYNMVQHPVLPVIGIAVVALLVDRVIRSVLDWYIHEKAGRNEATWDDEVLPLAKRFSSVVVFFVALSMALSEFGLEITALVTTAGVASFAVAFASQETLANMIAGVTILVDRPFKVGELIELADGKIGFVDDIGLRTTRIKQFDGNALLIPNKDIVATRVVNFNLPNPMRAIREEITVSYGTDVERAKEIVMECLKAQPEILQETPNEPVVVFLGFGPSELKLFAIGWVDHWSKWFPVKERFLLEVLRRFRAEGIEIPFPQRDVHLYYENTPPWLRQAAAAPHRPPDAPPEPEAPAPPDTD